MAENEGGLVGGTIDPVDMPGLGAERTTEQVVADIIAKDPDAHSVTLAERQRRAADVALAQAKADKEFFDEAETAGEEPGPASDRGTAREEQGDVDGPLGAVSPTGSETDDHLLARADGDQVLAGGVLCVHSWQEPVEAETPCIYCGLTFEEFANS
ncbi:MAG: hypothetical protein Q8P46_15495 [Hyphomicrobiales bacterium]|nr:hypothetical protein [Hyphomicrobiales bacterium]